VRAGRALKGGSNMTAQRRDVIVVGGGISGLTTAWRLEKAGVDVCLLEAAPRVGGCSQTKQQDGFLLEQGPFNVMVRDPSFEAMLEDVSGPVRVIPADDSSKLRFIYRHGRLHVVPTNPISLLTSQLLSFGAKLRLFRGLLWSSRPQAAEETIEQVVTRRLGAEVADTMVSAAVNGILAGDISKLSLPAVAPTIARFDGEMRSPIGYGLSKAFGGRKNKKPKHKRKWRGLVSIDGGLGALMEALAARLGNDCLTGCRVQTIKADGDGYEVSCESGKDEAKVRSTILCKRLVLAVSVAQAARLLADEVPAAAEAIRPIVSAPLIVLNLGYRTENVGHPLRGFGFLVPRNEPALRIMGALWADSVFPQHAPDGHRLIRAFIGGAQDPESTKLTDDELLAQATVALRPLLQITGDPTLVDIVRYEAALPQYHAGHRERIARFREAIGARSGLLAVGNYLDGASLNDCVRVGNNCAQGIIDAMDSRSPSNKSGSRNFQEVCPA